MFMFPLQNLARKGLTVMFKKAWIESNCESDESG